MARSKHRLQAKDYSHRQDTRKKHINDSYLAD